MIERGPARVVLDGLAFPEGPRWHDGRFWFSDVPEGKVIATTLAGEAETMLDLGDAQPSGLGWTPDGDLLVVGGLEKQLLRRAADGTVSVVAELADLCPRAANDMVVDAQGRAYIGNWGFDFAAGESPASTVIVLVTSDGHTSVAADGVLFPNGTVITPDGKTLVVAETFASKLTAFDIANDGSLTGRRTYADLPGKFPDGICLDAEGAIWVANAGAGEVVRVADGGEILERVTTDRRAFACALGGEDRRTLLICNAAGTPSPEHRERTGQIQAVEVDAPGAGLP